MRDDLLEKAKALRVFNAGESSLEKAVLIKAVLDGEIPARTALLAMGKTGNNHNFLWGQLRAAYLNGFLDIKVVDE